MAACRNPQTGETLPLTSEVRIKNERKGPLSRTADLVYDMLRDHRHIVDEESEMLLSVLVTSLVVGLAPLCQAQAAGTSAGKFVVLGCRDGQTSAWEYVPGSGELVKRYDFPQCQGTPRRLGVP